MSIRKEITRAVIVIVATISLLAACVVYSKVLLGSANKQYWGNSAGFLEINGKIFNIETASTSRERLRGLSGRNYLCPECGMLFVFEEKGNYSFWMKDMQFDLDIIWIADSRVVGIEKNIPHSQGRLRVVRPKMNVDKALEINAGSSDARGILIGDLVK